MKLNVKIDNDGAVKRFVERGSVDGAITQDFAQEARDCCAEACLSFSWPMNDC